MRFALCAMQKYLEKIMLKNYLKSSLRFLKRSKVYTTINLAGLSIGLAVAILIGLWIKNELSFDRYNKNADRIYRVTTHFAMSKIGVINAMSSISAANALRKISGVQNVASFEGMLGKAIIKYNNTEFEEKNFTYADSNFFKVFTIRFIEGNPSMSLNSPNTVVINESLAKIIFHNENPIGKSLSLNINEKTENYSITGVMKDIPENSHFHYNMILSLSTLNAAIASGLNQWYANVFYNYFAIYPNASLNSIKKELNNIVEQNLGKPFIKQYSWKLDFQKLTDIHLHSHLLWEIEPNGNVKTLYIYLSIGILILLIAVINFVSLSTARYSERAKEIGVRKVSGADRKMLVTQFIGEAVMLTLIASIIAVSFAEAALPYFNELTGSRFAINTIDLLLVFASCILIGILAGSYPAFFLASFQPDLILRKDRVLKKGGVIFRKGFVVIQFILAAGIIVAALVIFNQLNYVNNKDLGFEKDNIIVVPLYSQESSEKYPVLKNEFMNAAGVVGVTGSSSEIGISSYENRLVFKNQNLFEANWLRVDYNFANALGIKITSGRNFSPDIPSDTNGAILVNEAAAGKLRKLKILDKQLEPGIDNLGYTKLHVIGTIGNFNYMPLYKSVKPLFFVVNPNYVGLIYIKVNPKYLSSTLAELKNIWEKIIPQYPFDYQFLDQDIAKEYKNDRKLSTVTDTASLLAIFISMLGLLGLANFTVEKKIKEIGIRKVLGASVSDIFILLSGDFIKLIFIADVIAFPAAYFFINKWLQTFAFRVGFSIWFFAATAFITLIAALATISFQTIKAAAANPVKSLRYE